MKLYSYSSELLTFVETKWVIAKIAMSGILIGIIPFFGVILLNQSAGEALDSRSANTLAAENNFLRQQLSLISPRVSKLEMQAGQLSERSNEFQMLLHRPKIAGDTVSSFTNAIKEGTPFLTGVKRSATNWQQSGVSTKNLSEGSGNNTVLPKRKPGDKLTSSINSSNNHTQDLQEDSFK